MNWRQRVLMRPEREPGVIRSGDVHLADPDTRVDDAWAQLWFAIQRHTWTTLAVVPAAPTRGGRRAAIFLAMAGRRYHESSVEFVDGTRVDPDDIGSVIAEAAAAASGGAQVIVAVDSPLVNPASVPIVRAIGVALLVVPLGETTVSDARRTIESIGREQFIGSITVPRRAG